MKTFDETTEALRVDVYDNCNCNDCANHNNGYKSGVLEGRNSSRESLSIACRALKHSLAECAKLTDCSKESPCFGCKPAYEAIAAIKARGDWVEGE